MFSRSALLRTLVLAAFMAVALLVCSDSAFAQTTPFVDYDALAATGKTELGAVIGKVAGPALVITIGLVGVGMLFRWLKRAAKAS
jgi:hypothetical protein